MRAFGGMRLGVLGIGLSMCILVSQLCGRDLSRNLPLTPDLSPSSVEAAWLAAEKLASEGLSGDGAATRDAIPALDMAEAALKPARHGVYLCHQLRALCHDLLGQREQRDALLRAEMDRVIYDFCFGADRRAEPAETLDAMDQTMRGLPPPSDEWTKDRFLAQRMLLVWGVQVPPALGGFEAVASSLTIKPGDDVADIGCGVGPLSFILARRVGPTGSVSAVDVSESALDFVRYASGRLPGGERVRAVLSDPTDVKLPGRSQDVAVMMSVYHCLADDSVGQFRDEEHVRDTIDPFLASVARAVRPGGRLYVIDNIPDAETVVCQVAPHGFHLVSPRPDPGATYTLEFRREGR